MTVRIPVHIRTAASDPLGIMGQIEALETELAALDVASGVLDNRRHQINHELSELRFVRWQQHVSDTALNRAARRKRRAA